MLRSLAVGLGGVALFLAAGWGLSSLCPLLCRMPRGPRAGYSYLLGVAGVCGALYFGSHLAGLPLRRPVILTLAFGLAALALRRPLRAKGGTPLPKARIPVRPPLQRWARAAALGLSLLVVAGLVAECVSRPPEDWDGRMTWSARAKDLRGAGTVDAEVLLDPRWSASHPRYPLLLPLAQAVVTETFATGEDDPAFRILYPAFFAALLLIVQHGARRWAGPLAASLALLLLVSTPLFSFWQEGGALGAYSDLPLAAFYGAGLLLLLRRDGRRPWATLSTTLAGGLLLAAAVLTKNEGTPLALLAVALAALHRLRPLRIYRDRPRAGRRSAPAATAAPLAALAPLVALAPILGSVALLQHWRAGIPNRDDESYLQLLAGMKHATAQLPQHLGAALPEVARQALSWQHWHLTPGIAILLLALGLRGLLGARRGLTLVFLAAAAAPLLLAWTAYAVHWDPAGLARVTWNRLTLQGVVPWTLLLALALRRAAGTSLATRKP